MIIGYARSSTEGQRDGLEAQIHYLQDTLGVETIFSELASGRNSARPELAKLLEYARPGDTVAVQRLDRLARSLTDLIRIVNTLQTRGIHLKSGHETIDTSTASGRLIFHIFCSLAEFEASLTRERTMVGLENARRKGRRGGRPRKLNETDIVMLKTIKDTGKVSVRELAKKYHISPSTLYSSIERLERTENRK
jgi:DNA invertase Pin-like site-specific DNA recombinase